MRNTWAKRQVGSFDAGKSGRLVRPPLCIAYRFDCGIGDLKFPVRKIRFEFYAKTLFFVRGTLGPLIFLPPTPRAIASPERWATLEMLMNLALVSMNIIGTKMAPTDI